MTQNVRLQNLRDFTVQIRNADDQIVGTGIAVSTDGKIVTCAHVVEAALGVHPRHANGAEVGVYFPQVRGGEEKNRKAVVEKFFPDNDDDVVLLQLTSGASPLAPEQIAILGTAEESQDNPFRSYGYRNLQEYSAGWADGIINGSIEPPPSRKLQIDPIQITSSQINGGMSGSAVLDKERNLIVGIISETWIPDSSTKDRDTGWAVNSHVLSLAPLGLSVQNTPLALKAAPEPKFDIAQAEAAVFIKEKYSWNNAPSVLTEWTGREDLLKQITNDWNNPKKHVTGLIGFGGEGKSSLARKWIDGLLDDSSQPQPTGIFWWGFYEKPNVDEFLELALGYFGVDPRRYPSSNQKAQIIGAFLSMGRYLFVLDGFEVMQYQKGDQYGLLQSNDLRDLLTYFARPDNQSFCLVTSRAPLLDLMDYTTYNYFDVVRLSNDDGYDLLVKLGVYGTEDQLRRIVSEWNGHALTLSLIGSYLVKRYKGDANQISDFEIEENRGYKKSVPKQYEHVGRILRRYDEHLTIEEKAFLIMFSIFRTPVHVSAFEKVFRAKTKTTAPNVPLTNLSDEEFNTLVEQLTAYRILRFDKKSQTYTTHPLIRNHYFAIFTKGDPSQEKAAHEQIKDYYLSIAGDTPQYPTLDDLKPLIEVVHHACEAGAYDEASNLLWGRIYRTDSSVILHQLGAYERCLSLLVEFFSNNDTLEEPQVSSNGLKRWILGEMGICLMSLGRLREAVPFNERVAKNAIRERDWEHATQVNQNLANIHAHLGILESSAEAARQALDFAQRAENKTEEYYSLTYQARTFYLKGNTNDANNAFKHAESLKREIGLGINYLHGIFGMFHAEYLQRTKDNTYAREVMNANLKRGTERHFSNDLCWSHRVLGDLDSDAANYTSAREHYEFALKIARNIQKRDVLIEALVARGRFLAKHMKDTSPAFSDLNEALVYCGESGYRIYEANVRVALGWAYLANGEKEKAKESAERALQMSNEMGYHWGKVDADEVLGAI